MFSTNGQLVCVSQPSSVSVIAYHIKIKEASLLVAHLDATSNLNCKVYEQAAHVGSENV